MYRAICFTFVLGVAAVAIGLTGNAKKQTAVPLAQVYHAFYVESVPDTAPAASAGSLVITQVSNPGGSTKGNGGANFNPIGNGVRFAPRSPSFPSGQPASLKPVTLKPATIKPVTLKPVTLKPVTIKPVTLKPATIKPVTIKPVTVKPVTLKPVTLKPVTLKPVTLKPVTLKPVTLKPVTLKPVTLKPITLKPITLKPVTIKPCTIKCPPYCPPFCPPVTIWLPTTVINSGVVVVEPVAVAEELPKIKEGDTITLGGQQLGEEAGQVQLKVGQVTLFPKLKDWQDGQVTLVVPFMGLEGPVAAELFVIKADGEIASALRVEIVPGQPPKDEDESSAADGTL